MIGIDFILRANTAAFTRGMASVNNSLKDVKSSLRGFGGGSLGSLIGIGGIIAGFKAAVNHAQELRDEAHKLGKAIDNNTRSVAEFGDGMAEVKNTMADLAVTGLSFFTRAGEGFGMLINRIRGVTAEQEAQGAASKKAADEQEKLLAKSREVNSPERLASAEAKLQAARRTNLLETSTLQERINLLTDERKKLNQEADALGANTVARKEKELEVERVTGEIRKVDADLQKELAKTKEEQAKKSAEIAALAKAEQTAREGALIATQEQYTADVARSEELRAQAAALDEQERKLTKMLALSGMLNVAGGGVFNEASDSALRERLRRSGQTVVNQQNSMVGRDNSVGAMIVGADIGRLQAEIANIKAELSFRESLRRDYAIGGEAMARRNFKGDPVEFDRVFQQLVQDGRDSKEIGAKTLDVLERLEQRQRTGAPVVLINGKG